MANRRKKGTGTIRKRSDGRYEGRVIVGYDDNGGMVRQIDTNLWEGRFSPRNAQGKRISKNIYAKTEAECEAKLKVLIEEMKAEIKAEKAMLKAQESGITISM